MIIDSWFSANEPIPISASEKTAAFASTLKNSLDRPLDAFAVAQDALQFLGNVSDGRSEKLRIDVLLHIGLLENWLGRPDRAERTWAEVAHGAEVSELPAASSRRRQTNKMRWWMATIPYSRGEYSIAWTELTKHEKNYLKLLESPNSSAADRADARTCLAGITSFLADVALHLGQFEDSIARCGEWERDIRKFYYFELDAGRRLARCNLTLAEAAFCQGQISNALAAIQVGLQHNRNTPETYGCSFAVVQDNLILLRSEITAFSFGSIDEAETSAALTRLESTCAKMLTYATSHGWYLVDLLAISTTLARAAAMALRLDDRVRAESIANEVLTRLLVFLPRFECDDESKWVTDLARIPRIVSNAVLSKARSEDAPADIARVAIEGIEQLMPALRRRYSHIFSLCGFEIEI
jgi:tetratricopeptide (TPR) repeat protein